jgi:hypothetical protein
MTKQLEHQHQDSGAHDDAPRTPASPPSPIGRVVSLPWGKARVEEEVAVEGSASGERHIEVGVTRLRARDGEEQLLRFFYRTHGTIQRGPLTLRESEIDELAAALAHAPELRAMLRRLAGVPA